MRRLNAIAKLAGEKRRRAAQLHAKAAFELCLIVTCRHFDVSITKARTAFSASPEARVRTVATYLAITHFNVNRHVMAQVRRVSFPAIHQGCYRIEDCRDDQAFDLDLERIEQKLEAAA